MKLLLSSAVIIFFAIVNLINPNQGFKSQPLEENINLDNTNEYYFSSKNKTEKSDITTIECSACHGGVDILPTAWGDLLESLSKNYNPSLTIHQEVNVQFIESLQDFVEIHNDEEALEKYVDRQKVIDFINEY